MQPQYRAGVGAMDKLNPENGAKIMDEWGIAGRTVRMRLSGMRQQLYQKCIELEVGGAVLLTVGPEGDIDKPRRASEYLADLVRSGRLPRGEFGAATKPDKTAVLILRKKKADKGSVETPEE